MKSIELNGAWNLRKKSDSSALWATVPGCVHNDLLAAGKIPDPYYRDNEDRLQWIGKTDWTYSLSFEVPKSFLDHKRVFLRCEGLDTLATVRINGKIVGEADNMFHTWEFDVKNLLHAGSNKIDILFRSVVPKIEKLQKTRSMPGWSGPKEIKGRSWIRKEQCNFGWDWGPALTTCGIWRPISLIAFDQARINDLMINQRHSQKNSVRLDLSVCTQNIAPSRGQLIADVSVRLRSRVVARRKFRLNRNTATASVALDNTQLWWPNGMGAQPLYEVTCELKTAEGAVLDTWKRKIGLRTLRLERKKDQWGECFQFVVNGIPFFAKGANWIPPDAIYPKFTAEKYRQLLQDAADSNMNMLRVWGGGVYPEDIFYTLCDELGICIWHDFMFACAAYPTFDRSFMKSVAAEVEDNVRRVRHHPSIAMWCGNNELEQGLVGEKWTSYQMSWKDYGKLFDDLLPRLVKQLDPQRDYWPCSPHTPVGDRKDFNNPDSGDAHLWSVWHGRQPFEWYRTCNHRFNSEFGFQSFPEPKTVAGYTKPEDRNITSYVMEHHQRSGIGNDAIMQYMLSWFQLPRDFDSLLWVSQILQSLAIKYAVEHWRRTMPRGMGTLYWQLNDCWPVASWASIDYHGRWKALQYAAKKFFAPLIVSALENSSLKTVEIHVTSDLLKAVKGAVTWRWTDCRGRTLDSGEKQLTIGPRQNTKAKVIDASKLVQKHGERNVILWLSLKSGGKVVSTNVCHFARPKHLELASPSVALKARRNRRDGSFEVTLRSKRPALWTWLEVRNHDARWSDNFVHLQPGVPVVINAKPLQKINLLKFRKELRVRTIQDTY